MLRQRRQNIHLTCTNQCVGSMLLIWLEHYKADFDQAMWDVLDKLIRRMKNDGHERIASQLQQAKVSPTNEANTEQQRTKFDSYHSL